MKQLIIFLIFLGIEVATSNSHSLLVSNLLVTTCALVSNSLMASYWSKVKEIKTGRTDPLPINKLGSDTISAQSSNGLSFPFNPL